MPSVPPLARLFLVLLSLSTALVCLLQAESCTTSQEGLRGLKRVQRDGEAESVGGAEAGQGWPVSQNQTNEAQAGARSAASRTRSASRTTSRVSFSRSISAARPTQLSSATQSKLGVDRLVVSPSCAASLSTPITYITRLQLQSLSFIPYSLWILALGWRGVLKGSRQHVVVVVGASAAAAGFAVFQTVSIKRFHEAFHEEIAVGPCADAGPLLSGFWSRSLGFQTALTVLQSLSVFLLAFIAFKLSDTLKWQTFHRTGADRGVAKQERRRVILEVAMMAQGGFVVGSQAIWLRQLFYHPWSSLSRASAPHLLGSPYRIALLVITILLPFILAIGWYSMKRQHQGGMAVFLGCEAGVWAHTLFLVTQRVYLSTASSFGFLTFLTSLALVFTSATLVLGVLVIRRFEAVHASCWVWYAPFTLRLKASVCSADFHTEKDLPALPTITTSTSSARSSVQTLFITLPLPRLVPSSPLPSPRAPPSSIPSPRPDSPVDPTTPAHRPVHLTINIPLTRTHKAAHSVHAVVAVNPDDASRIKGGEMGVVGSRWSCSTGVVSAK